jgi:hypothetical protein
MSEPDFDAYRRVDRFVHQHVHACVSGLVHTLASNHGRAATTREVDDLCEQAFELCHPTVDRDARVEALRDAGYRIVPHVDTDGDEGFALVHEDDTVPGAIGQEGAAPLMVAYGDEEEAAEQAVEFLRLEDAAREHAGEIYEHWVVSDWLAARLREKGHTVGGLGGLTVWGRPATGQAISMDPWIQEIFREFHADR